MRIEGNKRHPEVNREMPPNVGSSTGSYRAQGLIRVFKIQINTLGAILPRVFYFLKVYLIK